MAIAEEPIKIERVDSVPLDRAVLCMDCSFITAATNGHCPVCGNHALVRVQSLLDREFESLPESS